MAEGFLFFTACLAERSVLIITKIRCQLMSHSDSWLLLLVRQVWARRSSSRLTSATGTTTVSSATSVRRPSSVVDSSCPGLTSSARTADVHSSPGNLRNISQPASSRCHSLCLSVCHSLLAAYEQSTRFSKKTSTDTRILRYIIIFG